MTAQEKQDLGGAIKHIDLHAQDLMHYALALAEILENPKEEPRADGGRPLRYVNQVWEDAADKISEMQKTAMHCADALMHLKSEIDYCIENPTTSDDKMPPEPTAVAGSKVTPEEKGIMPNVRPGTMEAVSRIIEALPGVKPHIRKDGIIEISL